MTKQCKKCGSYAFNLYKDDLDQGDLCDLHYWQHRAEKAEQALAQPKAEQCKYPNCDYPCMNLPDCKEQEPERAGLRIRYDSAGQMGQSEATDNCTDCGAMWSYSERLHTGDSNGIGGWEDWMYCEACGCGMFFPVTIRHEPPNPEGAFRHASRAIEAAHGITQQGEQA